MKQTFSITRKSREILLKYLENYTLQQLNKIPEGFNNNLYWNIAHIVVSQQRIIYALSGKPEEMVVSEELIQNYMRGTRPMRDVTAEEVTELKELLFTTIDKTEADYNNGMFEYYKEYTTELGYTLNSVEEGLEFNNYHEGLHLGCMLSIKKFV